MHAPENSCRPAADALFSLRRPRVWRGHARRGAHRHGPRRAGRARAIAEGRGTVIAQDEFSSVVWGMPGEVVKAGLADAVLPLSQIGVEVSLRAMQRRCA